MVTRGPREAQVNPSGRCRMCGERQPRPQVGPWRQYGSEAGPVVPTRDAFLSGDGRL
jgi:hypothetical protein